MPKRLVFLLLGINVILLSGIINANADEIYYTNNNNVSMTKAEYDYFGELYFEGYQEYVTTSEYNKFKTRNYFEGTIQKVEYDESITGTPENHMMPRATIHETNAKKLTIAAGCAGGICTMVTTLQWKGTPRVKSYDVIGALLYNNITLLDEPITRLYYSGGTISYSDEKYSGDGFGTSVKLRESTTNIRVNQTFDITGTGTVYASYQHAVETITKATSQLYTIGYGGDGGVFHFYGAAADVFDQMGGVYMTIS